MHSTLFKLIVLNYEITLDIVFYIVSGVTQCPTDNVYGNFLTSDCGQNAVVSLGLWKVNYVTCSGFFLAISESPLRFLSF